MLMGGSVRAELVLALLTRLRSAVLQTATGMLALHEEMHPAVREADEVATVSTPENSSEDEALKLTPPTSGRAAPRFVSL